MKTEFQKRFPTIKTIKEIHDMKYFMPEEFFDWLDKCPLHNNYIMLIDIDNDKYTYTFDIPKGDYPYDKFIDVIKKHEGCRLDMYKDTVDVWTIGYGHNLEEGIDQETADFILARDLEKHSQELDKHKPIWRELPDPAQIVILSMQFNMGWNRFSKFVKFWEAIEKKDYQTAGKEMENSRWWGQVKSRGPELQELLLSISEV